MNTKLNCSEMEKLHAIVLCFLMLAPITFQSVKGETFFIVTTSERPCFESGSSDYSYGSGHPENIDGSFIDEEPPCLTLQQFVERFTNDSYQNLANITLELDSGEHILNSTLSIFNITSFALKSDTVATIICSQPGVRLLLHSVEDIIISGVTFVGCKEIEIVFVDQFRFENSSFQSSPNGSLILNHTLNATVIGSSFLELTQSDCLKAAMTINKSSVLIQFCIFSNSQAGIYSTHSAITIDSCTFVNNSLLTSEVLYDKSAIVTVINWPLTSETVTVTNSCFTDNYKIPDDYYDLYTTKSVVIIDHDGPMLVLNNSFVNNTGIHELLETSTTSSQIIMDHNNFYDNEIIDTAVRVYAVNASITITHNNFTDNNATAVVLDTTDGMVTITDSTFSRNRPGQRSLRGYGAVAIECGYHCRLDDYSPLNVSIRIIQCLFISNYFPMRAVGIELNMRTGSISIIQSTFIANLASEIGAAVTIDTNSSVLIDSCTFIGNKGNYGGAVHIQHASSVLINGTNFLNNQGSMYRGAAMTLDVDNAVVVINESYFFGNVNTKKLYRTADKRYIPNYGLSGTIDLAGMYNSLIIDRSSFINNAVNAINAASFNEDEIPTGSIVILRSNFTNNTNQFDQYGGIVLITNTIKIAETTFRNNSAKECGALTVQVQDIHIANTHFVSNSAVNYSGGAICILERFNQMSISNSSFSLNYAKELGGVVMIMTYINKLDFNATIHISGCIFDNNRADLEGGVFWTIPFETFKIYINKSLFIKNQAGSDGGVLVMNSNFFEMEGQLIISGSSFDQNKASARGGVFSTFAPCTYLVNNSSFTDNQAGTDGGVMYVGGSNSQVTISDGSTFDFNNATDRGGVILINGSRLEISNTTVFNNNFAAIGDDIIACNCDISTAAFTLHSYTDPSFPNCILYGRYEVTTTDSHPTNLKPTEYVVAMAVSIPVGFVILLFLTATVFACLCFRRRKQYGVRRSDHPDFVPLMNNT